ncbi:MAG: type I DNA topoisomerase [Candidatus Pacebacteria bacterium CG_4_10_14_0_8_um_filter_42_14]|nr:MAG: type I DNA topoisomerase [Candidatus Pacebacteria bacterium CG_4_10_14_0_8_um_filter_42_14]
MQLVIVESPTKARKLSGYLGANYQVEASVGHVRDLPKSETGVDVEHDFEPKYVVSKDKASVLKKLKTAAAKADKIILATDPDREGEAIAWHVKEILTDSFKKGQKCPPFVRSTFYEITKAAVLDAINNPGEISMPLVDAQQARRVVDRLVGYEVSPVLWRKVRRGLSAGRVQSVALRLIAEREREIEAFIPDEYWEIQVALSIDKMNKEGLFIEGKAAEILPDGVFIADVFNVNGEAFKPKTEADVTDVVGMLPSASYKVDTVDRKERKRASLPPFTTSTLQQAAATRFGWSSRQTMAVAQNLYEEGHITYHRTDSFNLSQSALDMARAHISKAFGPEYLPEKARIFHSTSKNAQEAHEAIRVTNVAVTEDEVFRAGGKMEKRHAQLYDLIWRRFMASQMNSAIYDQTTITVLATPADKSVKTVASLRSSGSILKFPGWTRLFPGKDDTYLPDLSEKQALEYGAHEAQQKFTLPPPRYNDASLVKELEKRGIGRPSTYASIISVIVTRGYVERIQKRFFASAVGLTVSDFLCKNFATFMEYEFTAEMEEDLDRIARDEKEWHEVVRAFYGPFHKKVEEALDSAERAQIPVEKTGEICPDCGPAEGGEIVIRSGKYGKFMSCSRFPECKYTKNIVETVEGVICPLCSKGEVVVKNSRWGKPFYGCSTYPTCDWANWKKPEVGETITPAEWAVKQAERAERKAKYAERNAGKSPAKKSAKKPAKKKAAPKKTAKKK